MSDNTDNFFALLSDLGIDGERMPLLQIAFTHKSFTSHLGEHNERLEFLGDSVLSMIMSNYLYQKHPEAPEGSLAKLRAAIVSEESLSRAARRLEYGSLLRISRGEEATGGRGRDSILADCYEAVLACIYLSCGYRKAREFVLRSLEPEIKLAQKGELGADHKTALQELVQKKSKVAPNYRVLKEEGPDHRKFFIVEVNHDGRVLGIGKGASKKKAEQSAASEALKSYEP